MALLTKKEFAGQTGQTTKTLATYIGRKKVIARKDGLIDTNNETNKAFIAAYAWKAPVKNGHLPPAEQKTAQVLEPIVAGIADEDDDDEAPQPADGADAPEGDTVLPIRTSEKRYKHYLAEKTKTAKELDELKIKKLRGDVIPVAPIEALIFRFKQHMLVQQKITYEGFLNEVGHKYAVSAEDMAYYRGLFIKKLNAATEDATKDFLKGLDVALSEFAVKKGRGEKK